MALKWIEQYATGVNSIDRQHQKLFDYLNRLEGYINQNVFEGTNIDDLINFLSEYVVMHFTHEENCMKNTNCPAAQSNKAAHAAFLEYFNKFKGEYASANSATRKALIQKLQNVAEDWLKSHICKIDVQLRSVAAKLN